MRVIFEGARILSASAEYFTKRENNIPAIDRSLGVIDFNLDCTIVTANSNKMCWSLREIG